MKKELEKLYERYFPMTHQKCSDECSKKYAENTMKQDFVNEVIDIFSTSQQEDVVQVKI